MIELILIAVAAVLFIMFIISLVIEDSLNSLFQDDIEKRLASVKNPLRFRISLSIYLKNYFRVGKDCRGLFHLYCKNQSSERGEYWTKYQSLDLEDFNRAGVYLDNLRQEKRYIILEKRRKNLALPKPKRVNEDFIIY